MATAAASYAEADLKGQQNSSVNQALMPNDKKPRFCMKKGVRIQAGHILWQGRYVDQNQFYRVSLSFITYLAAC